MDQGLRNWIIKKHTEMGQGNKKSFLRALKFTPNRVMDYISSNLRHWGICTAIETCQIVHQNFETDPEQVMEALKKHFAKELDSITQ